MPKKYGFDEQPNTFISEESQRLLEERSDYAYTILVGRNNSGKTFLLRMLTLAYQGQGSFLGTQRFYNFNALSPYSPKPNKKAEIFKRFQQQSSNARQNPDNSPFNVQQAIAELTNDKRDKLFEMVKAVLGAELSLEKAHDENEMSQRYISCNGYNFSFASSGVRLIVSILTSLLDEEYHTFLIDEPELGVSPESQGQLADFLFDRSLREHYFPHIKSLFMSTHSTIFLDRLEIENNFTVRKTGDEISVQPVHSLIEFNKIHFYLLGNRLESLFLPSFIIFVEGDCEEIFLSKVLEIKFPHIKFNIINSGSDANMKRYAHTLSQIIPDLQKSPFRDRIICVLDKMHDKSVVDLFLKKGIPSENIVVWSENGIEYLYPEESVQNIFGVSGPISINNDTVTCRGENIRKVELAKRVAGYLSEKTVHKKELEEKLFTVIANNVE